MRKRATTGFVVIAASTGIAACGGNYSNEDLEFLSALPVQSELRSKLPEQALTQSGLTGTRQDALSLGDPSQLYLATRSASDGFNRGLFALLMLIDDIRLIPPTHREPDKRMWGPFPDKDRPGFITEVVMDRTLPVLFGYRIETKRSDAPTSSPWVPLVQGEFRATGGARKGACDVHLLAQAARNADVPMSTDLDPLDTLDVNYVTDQSPVQVDMLFRGVPGTSFDTIDYAYREYDSGQGSIQFISSSVSPPQKIRVLARWSPSGAGRADVTVLDGPFQGAQAVECWDGQFRVTYSYSPWAPPAVGSPTSCAF